MKKRTHNRIISVPVLFAALFLLAGIAAAQFEPPGNVWIRYFGGENYDKLTALAENPEGGLVLSGSTSSFGPGPLNAYLIKTDSVGTVLWQRVIESDLWVEITSILVVEQGSYVLAGASKRDQTAQYNINVTKVDLDGNVLWTREIGGQRNDACTTILPADDGGFPAHARL